MYSLLVDVIVYGDGMLSWNKMHVNSARIRPCGTTRQASQYVLTTWTKRIPRWACIVNAVRSSVRSEGDWWWYHRMRSPTKPLSEWCQDADFPTSVQVELDGLLACYGITKRACPINTVPVPHCMKGMGDKMKGIGGGRGPQWVLSHLFNNESTVVLVNRSHSQTETLAQLSNPTNVFLIAKTDVVLTCTDVTEIQQVLNYLYVV